MAQSRQFPETRLWREYTADGAIAIANSLVELQYNNSTRPRQAILLTVVSRTRLFAFAVMSDEIGKSASVGALSLETHEKLAGKGSEESTPYKTQYDNDHSQEKASGSAVTDEQSLKKKDGFWRTVQRYVWDDPDKPAYEKKFLLKLDFFLLTYT